MAQCGGGPGGNFFSCGPRKVYVNPEGEAVESFDMPEGLVAADTPIQALNEVIFEHDEDRRRFKMRENVPRKGSDIVESCSS